MRTDPTDRQQLNPVSTRSALDAFVKFMRAYNSLRARLEPELTAIGVTPTQFGVLEALYHLGPMNQRSLGAKLLTSKGNLTLVVDNLEREGLVERRAVPEDRRQALVHLTSAGRRFVKRTFPRQARAIERELGVLSSAEQRELARLCKRLGRGATNT